MKGYLSKSDLDKWFVLIIKDTKDVVHIMTAPTKEELYQGAFEKFPGYEELKMMTKKVFDKNKEYFENYYKRLYGGIND